ncbi:MAG: hypothetical protein ABJB76_10105 [Candidatus Nitrosocosmicus sp.]
MLYQVRRRTKSEDIVYSLHLYFNGLSVRNTSKALSFCIKLVKRSHSAIRDWIQKYKPKRLFFRKINITEFIIDENQIKGWLRIYLALMGCYY